MQLCLLPKTWKQQRSISFSLKLKSNAVFMETNGVLIINFYLKTVKMCVCLFFFLLFPVCCSFLIVRRFLQLDLGSPGSH